MLRALIACLLGLTIMAPPAQAGWRIDRATQIAKYVWADSACVRNMKVSWEQPATEDQDAMDSLAWVTPGECIVHFNSTIGLEWEEFCRTMIHEAGHLAGYRDPRNVEDPAHSLNPRSVMYAYTQLQDVDFSAPDIGYVSFRDPRCRKNGRWYLGL